MKLKSRANEQTGMSWDYVEIESPLGALRIAETDGRLRAVEWVDEWERVAGALEAGAGRRVAKLASGAEHVFARYFAGDPGALDTLDVRLAGTPFQMRVWNALRSIPVGETRSYREIGDVIGAPLAVRAVGTANGRNPIAIVVPCHRVIRSDGTLGGYGGGLPRKEWLLAHEAAGYGAGR